MREPFGVPCLELDDSYLSIPTCKNSLGGTVQICEIRILRYVYFMPQSTKNQINLKSIPCPKRKCPASASCLKRKSTSPFARGSFSLRPVLPHLRPLLRGRAEHIHSLGRLSLLPDTSGRGWKDDPLKTCLHFHSVLLPKATFRPMSSKILRIRQRSSTSFTQHVASFRECSWGPRMPQLRDLCFTVLDLER